MTERVKKQLDLLCTREYRKRRIHADTDPAEASHRYGASCVEQARRFAYAMSWEKEPVFHGDDLFGFNRYCYEAVSGGRFGNVIIDYATVLERGLCGILEDADARREGADEMAIDFYDSVRICYEACFKNIDMYRKAAEDFGNRRLAEALSRVPRRGARNYYEALIVIRFLSYILRINRCVHLPIGRFDLYMKPYYDRSIAEGATREELLELTELFFIAMNFDSDLYIGIQKGDNGQSLVLGGCDRDGNDVYSELSELVLTASEELCLIDPKINLRVSGSTPLSLYERGTRLTKQGLGFPQYSNDDIAIPFLTSLGYDLRDARDYGMAACWEFMVSGNSADTPNKGSMNFPRVIDNAVREDLARCESFEEFLGCVRAQLERRCDEVMASCDAHPMKKPTPLISSFISPCVERGRDVMNGGAKYNNYGLHGAGISTAADSLAAIREGIFETHAFTPSELIAALDANFEGYDELRKLLLSYPKMGNNDDRADLLGCFLMDAYSSYLNGKPNNIGGIYRAGTGSAMEYILSAQRVGASPDGRYAFTPYASSYSPSPNARLKGPLSTIRSFTKFDLSKICNGGPFTIEIHDTVFRNDEGERKVAMLVKSFIDLGGHQIQINAINRDILLDAQKNPDKYPNLIVRVWGWSGYFNELDAVYQNHIISRMEFSV